MSTEAAAPAPGLHRHVTRLGLFALGFGSIVGSAWVVVLGEWLRAAGPGGAALGFAAGGVAMLAIAACYGELAARLPRVGGEFLYVLETLGRTPAFVVGWALTLNYVAFAAFEGIALSLLLGNLFPSIGGPELYAVFGKPVRLGGLAIGLVGCAAFAALNLAGGRHAVRFQSWITTGFLAFAIALVALGGLNAHSANLTPVFAAETGSWTTGALWIFATAALFLNGFQAPIQAVEERAEALPVSAVGRAMLQAVAVAMLFYLAIILSASAVAPWRASASASLPAVAAFGRIASWLGPVIVVAASLSLLKTWNALVIVGSRLLVAQGRAGVLPPALAAVSRSGAPTAAVALFSLASAAGLFLGLGGLIPILDTCAVCVALSMSLVVVVLLRQRAREPRAEAATPGGLPVILFALLAALAMGAAAAITPWVRDKGAIPLEWKLLAGWTLLGLIVLALNGRRARLSEFQ